MASPLGGALVRLDAAVRYKTEKKNEGDLILSTSPEYQGRIKLVLHRRFLIRLFRALSLVGWCYWD